MKSCLLVKRPCSIWCTSILEWDFLYTKVEYCMWLLLLLCMYVMVAKLWVLSHDFHFLFGIIDIIDISTLVLDDEWLIPCSVLLCWLWFNGFCYALTCHTYSNVIHSLSLAQMVTQCGCDLVADYELLSSLVAQVIFSKTGVFLLSFAASSASLDASRNICVCWPTYYTKTTCKALM